MKSHGSHSPLIAAIRSSTATSVVTVAAESIASSRDDGDASGYHCPASQVRGTQFHTVKHCFVIGMYSRFIEIIR